MTLTNSEFKRFCEGAKTLKELAGLIRYDIEPHRVIPGNPDERITDARLAFVRLTAGRDDLPRRTNADTGGKQTALSIQKTPLCVNNEGTEQLPKPKVAGSTESCPVENPAGRNFKFPQKQPLALKNHTSYNTA